jgi:hypothetical protein
LSASLSCIDAFSRNFEDHTMAYSRRAQIDPIRDINRALRSQGIPYTVPDNTKCEDLDIVKVESHIPALVESKDRALGAFLLIGAAGYVLEMASLAHDQDTIGELQSLARIRIDAIEDRSEGAKVNTAAPYDLLAEGPHGALELRKKLKRASEPLVILFLAADPSDAKRLRLLDERRTLDQIVQSAIIRNAFKVVDAPGCRIENISHALQRYGPTLLHFSAYSTPEGEFCFQNERGETAKVNDRAFANLLALAHEDGLKGAVLNAGYSDTDAQLLADATGCAVAMNGPLSNPDANTFTREFYRALGRGKTFDRAFKWAVAGARIDPHTNELRSRLFKRKHGALPPYS